MRLKPGHWAALDYVFGAVIAVLLFTALRPELRTTVVGPVGLVSTYQTPAAGPLAGFLLLATAAAAALRRHRPMLMLGVMLAASAALTVVADRPVSPLLFFLPVAYVLYVVAATYEQRQDAVRALTAVFATLIIDIQLAAARDATRFNKNVLLLVALCVIVVWTAGYTVRQRRSYAVRLQVQAASKAVAEERLRIARELHDVVAHSMSVIAVQAGYGQYVIDEQPQDAREALGAIQATSREALDEMRRMLGALRQADDADAADARPQPGGPGLLTADGARPGPGPGPGRDVAGPGAGRRASPLSPAPGLADLDRLISRTAGAGVRVEVTRFGAPRDLPPSIDLSAYRVVQEALTNVVKHARTGSCQVLLGCRDDELIIEVTDDGAGLPAAELASAVAGPRDSIARALGGSLPGGGHGIIGMRERVTLLGGEFSAGPRPGSGFGVRARIPLPPRGG